MTDEAVPGMIPRVSKLVEQQARLAERRYARMRELRARGWTLEAIGEKYGVSKQRVHQVVGRGLRPRNGFRR